MEHDQRRHQAYNGLSQLLAKLSPPSLTSLSQHRLQTLGIECTTMALHPQGDCNAHPRFCKLVTSEVMDEAFDRTFTTQNPIDWPEYDPNFSSRFYPAYAIGRTLLHCTLSGQMIEEPLVDTEWYATGDSTAALTLHRNVYPITPEHPYGHDQWGICQILRVDNVSWPHLACVHIDDAPADEGLRPSELISAVKLMKQAIRLDKRAQFRVNPIYVYSFSSYKARILETYYEAGTFFVKKTPYMDFTEENTENIKLYLRWMMSEPSGKITFASANDFSNAHGGTKDTESSATSSSEE